MATRRNIDIYYDVVAGVHRDINGAQLVRNQFPYIVYKEKPLVRLTLVTDDADPGTAYTDLDATLSYSASVDFDFDHSTDVMCKTISVDINVVADWASADPATGLFSIPLDANTVRYDTVIASLQSKRGTKLELLGTSGAGDIVAAIRMDFQCLNIMDDDGSAPAEIASAVYMEEVDGNPSGKCILIKNSEGVILATHCPLGVTYP